MTYIRSVKLEEPIHYSPFDYDSPVATTMWTSSLARLPRRAPALRSPSLHRLDTMIARHPHLAH
ncbi:uncharacterized protein LAESUDRAFT_724812 [Laetiporus sulphureus 93-53]|uniref:Uncharacterized protein n=1 Tax=Laetiporus sulphureus 93-53 TaxID=1314785 RepID=A0A165EMD6_9APHY|nr:uncharacterized protein LAESUDRAFT_724812 [Laetiporus sulphureus 93-53]KZT07362.1 hypothetical protein LAESUDRAFT_724812 [Laetiporus sulphureus 93-53]